MQNAIDPVTNAQIVLQRFDMNIGRALGDRFADDLVHKLYDRRFRIVGAQVGRGLGILQDFECAIGFKNFVERLGAHAVERFHRAQELGARHQHPLGRLFQKLRSKLAPNRIEKIIRREDDRVFLHCNRQNMMLEDESARQDRQCLAVDLGRVE